MMTGALPFVERLALQRKGGGGGGSATGDVGIPGGESATASDQDTLAAGYVASGANFTTPDGRTVKESQAKDESKVINSTGIFLAAYLARYNKVKGTYGLGETELGKLSAAAGFLKQYKTGDIVLRQMDAADSQGLAKITRANYSHTGIIKAEGGRVMVLDSYPHGKDAAGVEKDASTLNPFEDFFADHHTEKIVSGLVLRANGLTAAARADIAKMIDKYNVKQTTFDFDFSADNGATVLYCSELVTQVFREAGAGTVPPNEFDATKANVEALIKQLEALIAFQVATGTDPKNAQAQLNTLKGLVATVDASTVKELFSPGSFERTPGLDAVSGFGRDAPITGKFSVTVLDAVVPPGGRLDTPDPYVILKGGLSGTTGVKDDTTTPSWGQKFTGFAYDDLTSAVFQIRDSDVLWDDDIASVSGDVRPANPSGQTFSLSGGGATLRIKSAAEDTKSGAAQGPRDTTPL